MVFYRSGASKVRKDVNTSQAPSFLKKICTRIITGLSRVEDFLTTNGQAVIFFICLPTLSTRTRYHRRSAEAYVEQVWKSTDAVVPAVLTLS
jgi:hypothetical protein